MKKIVIYTIFVFLVQTLSAQVFLHPTAGIAGEYVGSCEVAGCSGTYYDNGGAGGNYSTFIGYPAAGGVYRVFCPNVAGQCIRATFTQFSIEGGAGCPYDLFTVTNSSTQNGPILFSGCGTGAIGPFTGTANGCLSFRFRSDNTVTFPGWTANLSCVACAGGPNGTSNNDCNNATLICSAVSVPANSTGPGIVAEACGGGGCPAGGENYSNWFSVSFVTSGTFSFTIVPSVASDDYDYSVYGPNVSCAALGPAIRCSDAALTGNTGLSAAAADVTESVTGDKFTAIMNVLAGQTYYIMVDEWTPTGAGFNMTLGGTAVISCVPLPVELTSFDAKYNRTTRSVNINWSTATERNCDYFAVERSIDGSVFEQIDNVKGANTSSQPHFYATTDQNPYPGEVNYYRLRQVDNNGTFKYSDLKAIVINDPESHFTVYPNPTSNSADILFHTAHESEYHLNIYDYTAKQVLAYHFKSIEGKNIIPLDLNGFSKGVYFVTLQGNGDMLKTSFVRE